MSDMSRAMDVLHVRTSVWYVTCAECDSIHVSVVDAECICCGCRKRHTLLSSCACSIRQQYVLDATLLMYLLRMLIVSVAGARRCTPVSARVYAQ